MAKREQQEEERINEGGPPILYTKNQSKLQMHKRIKYKRYICGRAKNRCWVPLNFIFQNTFKQGSLPQALCFQVSPKILSAPLSPPKREKIVPWISFASCWALEELSPILRMCQMWRASLNIRTFQTPRVGPVQLKGVLLPLSRSWK